MPSGVYTLLTEAQKDIGQAIKILSRPGAEDQAPAVGILHDVTNQVEAMMEGDDSWADTAIKDLGHAGSLVVGCDSSISRCGDQEAAAKLILDARNKVREAR